MRGELVEGRNTRGQVRACLHSKAAKAAADVAQRQRRSSGLVRLGTGVGACARAGGGGGARRANAPKRQPRPAITGHFISID
jgi:hypothetical protein